MLQQKTVYLWGGRGGGWFILWAILMVPIWIFIFSNCSKNHPLEPPEQAPPDTVIVEVVIIDTVIVTIVDTVIVPVTCDTVDMTVEFTLIKDQSAPNVYAVFLNGVEVERFVISETSQTPVEVMFVWTFERFVIGRDSISIQKISGSRAETIGSRIVKIECSS